MTNLARRLLEGKQVDRDHALREAVAARDEGSLVQALRASEGWHRVIFAAALGDLPRSRAGDDALREAAAATGPGSRDLRCAALVALSKRLDREATPDLRAALGQRDAAVREYAIVCAAAVGDSSAWPEVLDWLRHRRTPSRTFPVTETQAAVHYLLRELPAGEEARQELVTVLRNVWTILEKDRVAAWLESIWPGVQPGGPGVTKLPAPSAVNPDEWRSNPMFSAPATSE